MSNTVNFESLKRKSIYKTIGEEGEGQIIIYNPSPEQKKEILRIMAESADVKTGKIKVSGKTLLLKYIPLLTNIYINFDNQELIDKTLNDPSDILFEVQDCIEEIVSNVTNRTIKSIKDISELPDEVIQEVLKPEEQLTEEEQKTIEKAKRLGLV
jgi:hypothetical protein